MSRVNKNSTFEAIFRSSNFDLQQDVITKLFDQIELDNHYIPADSIVKSIVEDGLTSESLNVREKSYRVIQLLYHRKSLRHHHWNEVQAAVVGLISEIFEFDSENNQSSNMNSNLDTTTTKYYDKTLSAAIGLLCSLDDSILILFFMENINSIQKCFIIPDNNLRFISIIGLGKLLVRVINLLNDSLEIEMLIKVESYSDSKKKKDDFVEIALDTIKSFTKGVTGMGPVDLDAHVDMKTEPLQVTYNIY